MKLLLVSIASGLAFVACLLWGGPIVPWGRALSALRGTAAVYYEVRATRLPGAGFASCSFAPVLALGLTASVAPAALVAILACLVRNLGRAHAQPRMRALESLVSLVPQLVALATAAYLHQDDRGFVREAAAAAVIYVSLVLIVPEALAAELPEPLRNSFRTVYGRLWWNWLSCCACGLGMSLLAQGNVWWVLILLPLLGTLRDAMEQALPDAHEKGAA